MQNKSFFARLISLVVLTGAGAFTLLMVFKYVGPVPLSISSTVAQKQNLFTSSGTAELETIPDEAGVSLGINVQKPTVALAQDEANRVINSISDRLKSMGIDKEDIKTQNYSIYPDYNYENGNRDIKGYSVTANLAVKLTDFDKLNAVIDMATAEGANQVGGINFSLSTEKEKELKKQARVEAIEDAKESAEELARLSGVKLGKVVDVSESRGGGPMPYYGGGAKLMMADMAESAPTSIEPGSATYSYSVTLSYETL
ncbi:MAG: SIMPL domain-containing protein [Candidatus Pacebacteria bacterium]|nr:SIMPL domain-containing protein [Candidatus Paceibacterota bacterium]